MRIVNLLRKLGAIKTNDHFVYTSGKHGSVYIRKDMLYPHTKDVSRVGKLFAEKFREKAIDVVVGPAIGGIILSQWTAYHLSRIKNKDVLSLFTEKASSKQIFNKNQEFKRGYEDLAKNKNVLIVEDLTTTGGSVKKVVDAVKKSGAKSIWVCVMINRNPKAVKTKTIGAQFSQLGVLNAEAFDANDCPYCRENRPINTTVGHGKEYLKSRIKLL